ncbi:MAG TPA: hypothetical protein VNK41_03310 [Vicinamibacterales bacterium]|nr:hypothetical protein [Vicinamibacterales bacterium]
MATSANAGSGLELERGGQVPHFSVRDVTGRSVRYEAIWQRRNLVLAVLPEDGDEATRYHADLLARDADFRRLHAECVITPEPIPGLPPPAVLVADRWGEIAHVASAQRAADLPDAAALLEWLEWLEYRCPECEGEAK